jgi:putative nucleotidyltransferase with HDIG domain
MREPRVEDRWQDRRVLATSLGLAIVGIPVVFAVGLTVLAERLVARPVTVLPLAIWFLGVLGLSSLAFLAAQRVARRALPLKALLRMAIAFPGRPPRRLSVAWRAASVRDLDRKVAEAHAHGVADGPTEMAARIVSLAAAEAAHDRGTRGHSERVRALTDMIAEELQLGATDRDRLRWSALLHDVGKLAVHPHTLNKPGALSDEEWEQIRLHPLEGAKLVEPLAGWLGPWARTIAEHHERYDGSGYPAGLAGKEIGYGARIVAVADSYDVMTAARSYKKPIGPDAARQELARCAGSQFDPDVVRAFLAVSIWQLRFAAPLSWLGSFGFTPVAAVGRLGAAVGQTIATGVAATAVVVALTLAAPVQHVPAQASASGPQHLVARGGNAPGGSVPPAGSATPTTTRAGAGVAPAIITASGGAGGAPAPTPQLVPSPSTTTVPGSSTVPTTTTVPPTGSTTTTPSTTTTTTSTTTTTTTLSTTTATTTLVVRPPAPVPPGDLQARGSCRLLVLGPEISLRWTASTTGAVTSYVVLRSSNGVRYAAAGTVPAATTSYTDTSLRMDKKYWFKVEAIAPGGTATGSAVSAATPVLCL